MKDDVNNTFMNVDEFADMHTVDGKEIPVLVDDNEIIEREKKMKSNMDGVYVKQKLIYLKAVIRYIIFDGDDTVENIFRFEDRHRMSHRYQSTCLFV